jgi:guanosine-3',5'-bis(diphosphate) 3'-pyrophosphohydrolase
MSYLQQEKVFDQAVVFLAVAASKREELPIACILHSIRVGLSLQQVGYAHEVILGGFLHDVVEDTEASIKEVQIQFGPRVAELVEAMTYNQKLNAQNQSRDSIDRCKQLGKDALAIKAADLLDNLRFYLSEAKPGRIGQLAASLQYFLDTSADELGDEASWNEIKQQLENVLMMMDK